MARYSCAVQNSTCYLNRLLRGEGFFFLICFRRFASLLYITHQYRFLKYNSNGKVEWVSSAYSQSSDLVFIFVMVSHPDPAKPSITVYTLSVFARAAISKRKRKRKTGDSSDPANTTVVEDQKNEQRLTLRANHALKPPNPENSEAGGTTGKKKGKGKKRGSVVSPTICACTFDVSSLTLVVLCKFFFFFVVNPPNLHFFFFF